MADLTTQAVTVSGLNPSLTAAAGGGDTVQAGDNVFLVVDNASGGSINVTITVPGNTSYGSALPDPVIAVPAGEQRWIGMRASFANPTTRRIDISYSGTTSVTVAAVRV